MTFLRPELLLAGPAAALLLSLGLALQWRRLFRLGRAYGDPAVGRLAPRAVERFPTGRMLCLALASFALGAAAAGPRPVAPEPPEPAPPLDIAVAVDVSRSMGTADVEPTRIARAREVVDRLADALPSARIVLVLFADWPYTLVPPTDDPDVVRYFARSLNADLVLDRDQGTSFTTAVEHARAALDERARPGARRAVLLISDGGAHERLADVIEAATVASQDDVPIWTAGLGTSVGAPVPTAAGPLLDEVGQPVVSMLDESTLREIARAGGGRYEDVSEDRGLRALLAGLGALDQGSDREESLPPDAAFWLTLASIPLLLLEGAVDAGRNLAGRVGRRLTA